MLIVVCQLPLADDEGESGWISAGTCRGEGRSAAKLPSRQFVLSE